MKDTYTLLIDCADETGLVAKVTNILFDVGINIVSNDEFVCERSGIFYMRTEFSGDFRRDVVIGQLQQALPASANIRLAPKDRKKIVLMVTKEPYCLGDILVRCIYGDMSAEIQAVIGNRAELAKLVEAFGIPFHHIPADDLSREEHEAKVSDQLDQYDFDYLVLAKYMRILTSEFTDKYTDRIINIHHSFLPAFIGANPYKQAYERGVKIIGATAHFVNQDLDEGPIIAQDIVHVSHSQGPSELASAGRDVEKRVLSRALRLVLEDRVFVSGHKTVVFDG